MKQLLKNLDWKESVAVFMKVALYIFPGAILLVDHYSSAIIVMGLICAILLVRRADFKTFPLAKGMTVVFSLWFVWALLQWPFSEKPLLEFAGLSKPLRFLMFLPLVMLFHKLKVGERFLMVSVIPWSIVMGFYSIAFALLHDTRVTTVGCYPITFGDLTVVLGSLSLLGVKWFRRNRLMAGVSLFAAVMGLTASILSETRGAWLFLPFVVIIAFHYFFSRHSLRKRVAIGGVAALLLTGVGFGVAPVRNGFERAIDESMQYFQDEEMDTSSGLRILMWRQAIENFKRSPWVGIGPESFYFELEHEGGVRKFYHPHSSYFSALSSGGIVGLAVLLCFWGYPLYVCLSGRMKNSELAVPGVLVVVLGFAVFGLTEDLFAKGIFVSFYVVMMAWLVSLEYADVEWGGKARDEV
ncbi:O-antigen ligase family protein [Pontiella sp.]|uniref:O-antigen ligase family protein n=1 Tax=Pontiella sp. TaxID=2837462 RepID=UPI00356AC3EE